MLQQGCSTHTLGRRRPASRAGGGFLICRRGPLNGMTLAHKAVSRLPLPPRPGSGNRIVSSTPGAYKLVSGHQMFLGVIDSLFDPLELPIPLSISGYQSRPAKLTSPVTYHSWSGCPSMAAIVIQTFTRAVALFIPGRRHDASFVSLVQLVPNGKKGYSRCVYASGHRARRLCCSHYLLVVIAFDNVYDLYCRLNRIPAGALFHIPCSVA